MPTLNELLERMTRSGQQRIEKAKAKALRMEQVAQAARQAGREAKSEKE